MPSNGKLHVTVDERAMPVEVLDGQYQRVARRQGPEFTLDLPAGLYLVRCDLGSGFVKRLVKIEDGQTVDVFFHKVEVDKMPSAAIVRGTDSYHEYYRDAVLSWAAARAPAPGATARLLVFASRQNGLAAATPNHPVTLRGLVLRDAQGKKLLALPNRQKRTPDDIHLGRAMFSADLVPGGYLLDWPAEGLPRGRRVLQPLWLSEGWTTLVFANSPEEGGPPRRETVSIEQFRTDLGFDVRSQSLTTTEYLLLALRKKRQLDLPQLIENNPAEADFENPMLGLLGAYVLLESEKAPSDLLGGVLQNLYRLLGPHPDLIALRILAERRFSSVFLPELSLQAAGGFPPMLRQGLAALAELEWSTSDETFELSAAARLASLNPCSGAPWTFYWIQQSPAPTRKPSSPAFNSASQLGPFLGGKRRKLASSPYIVLNEAFGGSTWLLHHPDGGFVLPAETAGAALDPAQPSTISPIDVGEHLANVEGAGRIRDFLERIAQKSGAAAIHEISTDELSWAGLSQRQTAAVLNELKEKY